MSYGVLSRTSRRVGIVAGATLLVAGSALAAPLGALPAGATAPTTVYASPYGFDQTGTSGCTTLSDFCTLQGAFGAVQMLGAGSAVIYLEASGAQNSYQGESNSLYSFDDPGLNVTIEPDPSDGAGAVSYFDGRYLPGSSILTLTGSGSVTFDDVAMINGDSTTDGGALNIESGLDVTLNDATFENDQTINNSNGGAVEVDSSGDAQLMVTDSTFSDNWAAGVGGAIDGGLSASTEVTVIDSTFSDNDAGYGGAIGEGGYGGGTLDVVGSTFDHNSADDGGAIDNADLGGNSSTTVAFSTFFDNSGSSGAAIAGGLNGGAGHVLVLRSTIDNAGQSDPAIDGGGGATIFAGSLVSGSAAALCTGNVSDAGYNLEADQSSTCGFNQPTDVVGVDPRLAAPADNGGTTASEEAFAGSPAADAIPSSPQTTVTIDATNYILCENADVDQTGSAQATPDGCSIGALDATYLATPSTPQVIVPNGVVAATSTVTLSASGGSGPASYLYSTPTAGCSVVGDTLSVSTATLPLTCEVQVVSAAHGGYAASATSTPQSVTFVAVAQSALEVTSTLGRFASALEMTSSGGSGPGALSYAVSDGSASGCSLSATTMELTTTSAGTCVVVATKAAAGGYLVASSAPTLVDIAARVARAPTLRLVSSRSGVAFIAVTESSWGGDVETAVQYSLDSGRWRTAIRRGHGRIEVLSIPSLRRVSIEVRVYTLAGRSAPSTALRFESR